MGSTYRDEKDFLHLKLMIQLSCESYSQAPGFNSIWAHG